MKHIFIFLTLSSTLCWLSLCFSCNVILAVFRSQQIGRQGTISHSSYRSHICTYIHVYVCTYTFTVCAQSGLTLCGPTDCSPPSSSVHGIFPGKNTRVELPFPSSGDLPCLCFGSIPSFFLELFLHFSPVAYWAPTNLGSSSFSVLSFCLFMLVLGFSRQEY